MLSVHRGPVHPGVGAGHPRVEDRLRGEEELGRQRREAEATAAAAASRQETCHRLPQPVQRHGRRSGN